MLQSWCTDVAASTCAHMHCRLPAPLSAPLTLTAKMAFHGCADAGRYQFEESQSSVFQQQHVHIYENKNKNNSRMKRTKVSIVDLHAEQQARQQQGDGSYSGQKVTCTMENKRGILPDIVVADELVSWYASCLRRSYSKAVQQVTTRPADAARWR
jgi:hypothetical protein